MKNEALYRKTVDILVDAYFKDTLEHGNCYACAVGNMIAGNCGFEFLNSDTVGWQAFPNIYTGRGKMFWNNSNKIKDNPVMYLTENREEKLTRAAEILIKKTGYSFDELFRIENAFEKQDKMDSFDCKDEYMFNGLMAVINVLDEIHENKDEQVTQTQKSRFNKKLVCETVN